MNIEISPKEYERQLKWDDAMMYCQLLTIDGKDDWRLPTKEELDYIYNSENDFVGVYYWSSNETNASAAGVQNIYTGNQYDNYETYGYYVRAIRTI